jgi:uncharacterized membrane protein
MPVACLALLVAWQAGKKGPSGAHMAFLAILFGVVWAANPWAMPPTLAGIALLMVAGTDSWHWPGGEGTKRWLAIAAVGIGGWLITAPFHLGFKPFFQGIKAVFAWTDPGHLLLYGGCLLIPAGIAAAAVLAQTMVAEAVVKRAVMLLAGAATLVLAAATGRPTLVFLAVITVIFVIAVLTGSAGGDRPVLALAALGTFLFLVPEVVYVADGYGDDLHRMNTVFKAYIQGWILLAIAMPVFVRLGLRQKAVRWGVLGVAVALALPHPVGMVVEQIKGETWSLDGMAWMTEGDHAIVETLRREPNGTVVAEAVGGAYTEYARLSSASGVPAYLGWENHEGVWRGGEVYAVTRARKELVSNLYSSRDPKEIRALARKAGIHLVAIGSLERKDFTAAKLKTLAEAGEVVLDQDGGMLVRFGSPDGL